MKTRVRQLAAGVIEYRKPELVISPAAVSMSLLPGKKLSVDLTVSSANNVPLHLFPYVEEPRIRVQRPLTIARSVKLTLDITTGGLSDGDVLQGDIVILYNGGAIYDYDKREIVWHSVLSKNAKEYTEDVYRKFPDIGIEILLDDQIYVVRSNAIVKKHLDTERLSYIACNIDEVPDGWFKVLFALEPSRMDEFEAYMLAKGYQDVCFVHSFTHYFEMLPEGSSKGGALCHLAEITGISMEKTVAIGDYFNDFEMIQNAGMGVAVANAPQKLKDAAKLVVCDNDHHAVAELIYHLMNLSILER